MQKSAEGQKDNQIRLSFRFGLGGDVLKVIDDLQLSGHAAQVKISFAQAQI